MAYFKMLSQSGGAEEDENLSIASFWTVIQIRDLLNTKHASKLKRSILHVKL
jgi:hypothetical protein